MNINVELIFKAFFLVSLAIISIIDLRKLYIPNSLSFSLIVIGILYNWLYKDSLPSSLFGLALYSTPFAIIHGYLSDLLNKEVLGFGDIKLAMGIGASVGFSSFENIYLFFLYSFVIGSIYAIYLLIKIKKREIQISIIPFK